MRRWWPKSFFGLVLLAMTLISLPLLGLLFASDVLMDRLVRASSASVYRAVAASQMSQALQEQLINQERRFRQYQVLGRQQILDELLTIIRQIDVSINSINDLPQGAESKALLARLAEAEAKIAQACQEATSPKTMGARDDDFKEVAALGRQVADRGMKEVYREITNLHEEEGQAEHTLLLLASTSLPLTFLLVFLLTRLISKPIKQIDQGIHLLGQGEFDREIEVHGPADLVFLGQRLNWLRQKLKGYEQEKNKFAAHISHELKTPLASIHEASELLSEEIVGPVTGEQREVIHILRKNCSQLKGLIENLVGLTMAQAEKTYLNQTDFALESLIDETLASYRPALINNDLRLQTDLHPMMLHGDRGRLQTVLDNLLSNAIKYTPSGGVIRVRAFRQEDKAVVEVHDSGPGIPEHERHEVFSPFFQGSASCRSHVQGTGLGLAIAHEYVAAHNGTLSLARLDEAGACFRLTLPLGLGGEGRS